MFSAEEQEYLLSYHGEVLAFQLSMSKAAESGAPKTISTLHVRRLSFDICTGQFSQTSSGQFCFPGGHLGVQITCCRCTMDSRTGLYLPCVLISKRKKRTGGTAYLVLLLQASNEFECCLKFPLDYKMTDDIQLCDGPTVLWRRDRTLSYITLRTGTVMSAPLEFSCVIWAGDPLEGGIVVVGLQNATIPHGDGPNLSTLDGPIWGSEFVGYSLEKDSLLAGTNFLPHGYSSVISCMHVYVTEDFRLRTNVIAATSKKQLLRFQDGVPKDVCELPFEKPFQIQLASTGRGDLLFVVFFDSGDACAVWKDSFQVASCWHGVTSVLVDDFIGRGTEQILVVLKDSTSNTNCLSSFKLTDLVEVNIESGLPISSVDAATEDGLENRLRTLDALEIRLQAGLASVQELQQHLQLKGRVLSQSCAALVDLCQGRPHALPSALELFRRNCKCGIVSGYNMCDMFYFKKTACPNCLMIRASPFDQLFLFSTEGLVSLWDDEENPCVSSEKADLPSPIPENPVERVWQRVVDDSWVVGVKLSNSADLSLSEVSLSLLMEPGLGSVSPVTVCHSDVLKLTKLSSVLPGSARQMEPLQKRVKLGHSSGGGACSGAGGLADWARTATAVTALAPLLAWRNVTCLALLHARRRPSSQHSGSEESECLVTFTCGRISLQLEDMCKRTYSADLLRVPCTAVSMVEDFFAFLAAFRRFTFGIRSPDSTLSPMNIWLQERMKCKQLKDCRGYLLYNGPETLHQVLLHWSLERPDEGTLTVFCRNHAILFQFLHHLIGILSPFYVIKPLMQGSKEVHVNDLAQSLEAEMVTHRRSVTSVINEAEKDFTRKSKTEKKINRAAASAPNARDAVQQYRDELQSDQRQSQAGGNLAISGDLYRDLTLRMAQFQLKTDSLARKLTYL